MDDNIRAIKDLLKIKGEEAPYCLNVRVLNPETLCWGSWSEIRFFASKKEAFFYSQTFLDSENITMPNGFRWEVIGFNTTRRQYQIVDKHGRIPQFCEEEIK